RNPRNEGQFPFALLGSAVLGGRAPDSLVMRRGAMTFASSAGDQALPFRIIRRGTHSSATRLKMLPLPSRPPPYPPGPSQAFGALAVTNSSSSPVRFQLPLNAGQPAPSSLNAPSISKRAAKAPNFNGVEGICTSVCWLAPAGLEALVATIAIANASANPSLPKDILFIDLYLPCE